MAIGQRWSHLILALPKEGNERRVAMPSTQEKATSGSAWSSRRYTLRRPGGPLGAAAARDQRYPTRVAIHRGSSPETSARAPLSFPVRSYGATRNEGKKGENGR
ncbi:unnamed protein product, partial [Ixodes hexagonus]